MSSKERRGEVLRECDAGRGAREVAAFFRVSESWVRRVKQERRESGKVAPKLTRDRRQCWEPHADWLRETVAAAPDVTLRELVAAAATAGWTVSGPTLCRALKALGLTRKTVLLGTGRSCPPNSSVPTSPRPAASGSPANSGSIPPGSSASTRRGPRTT